MTVGLKEMEYSPQEMAHNTMVNGSKANKMDAVFRLTLMAARTTESGSTESHMAEEDTEHPMVKFGRVNGDTVSP